MHREQIEAIVEGVIERTLGNAQTLTELHEVLKKSNVKTLRPGESGAVPMNASLFHSLFISHARLAQVVGELAELQQGAQNRLGQLEQAMAAAQEAVIDLQVRIKAIEQRPDI
jgi:hypothetical protein